MNGAFVKNRTALIAAIALCGCRILEGVSLMGQEQAGRTAAEGLLAMNNTGFASFVAVPLFGIILSHSAGLLSSKAVILAHGTRSALSLRYLLGSLVQSFSYSLVLDAAALPILLGREELGLAFFGYLALALALQTAFFVVCSLFFYLLCLTARTTAIAYVAVLAYGLWDFVAAHLVGGGMPFIGWDRTLASLPLSATELVAKASFLGALACASFLAVFLVVRRSDFLTRRKV